MNIKMEIWMAMLALSCIVLAQDLSLVQTIPRQEISAILKQDARLFSDPAVQKLSIGLLEDAFQRTAQDARPQLREFVYPFVKRGFKKDGYPTFCLVSPQLRPLGNQLFSMFNQYQCGIQPAFLADLLQNEPELHPAIFYAPEVIQFSQVLWNQVTNKLEFFNQHIFPLAQKEQSVPDFFRHLYYALQVTSASSISLAQLHQRFFKQKDNAIQAMQSATEPLQTRLIASAYAKYFGRPTLEPGLIQEILTELGKAEWASTIAPGSLDRGIWYQELAAQFYDLPALQWSALAWESHQFLLSYSTKSLGEWIQKLATELKAKHESAGKQRLSNLIFRTAINKQTAFSVIAPLWRQGVVKDDLEFFCYLHQEQYPILCHLIQDSVIFNSCLDDLLEFLKLDNAAYFTYNVYTLWRNVYLYQAPLVERSRLFGALQALWQKQRLPSDSFWSNVFLRCSLMDASSEQTTPQFSRPERFWLGQRLMQQAQLDIGNSLRLSLDQKIPFGEPHENKSLLIILTDIYLHLQVPQSSMSRQEVLRYLNQDLGHLLEHIIMELVEQRLALDEIWVIEQFDRILRRIQEEKRLHQLKAEDLPRIQQIWERIIAEFERDGSLDKLRLLMRVMLRVCSILEETKYMDWLIEAMRFRIFKLPVTASAFANVTLETRLTSYLMLDPTIRETLAALESSPGQDIANWKRLMADLHWKFLQKIYLPIIAVPGFLESIPLTGIQYFINKVQQDKTKIEIAWSQLKYLDSTAGTSSASPAQEMLEYGILRQRIWNASTTNLENLLLELNSKRANPSSLWQDQSSFGLNPNVTYPMIATLLYRQRPEKPWEDRLAMARIVDWIRQGLQDAAAEHWQHPLAQKTDARLQIYRLGHELVRLLESKLYPFGDTAAQPGQSGQQGKVLEFTVSWHPESLCWITSAKLTALPQSRAPVSGELRQMLCQSMGKLMQKEPPTIARLHTFAQSVLLLPNSGANCAGSSQKLAAYDSMRRDAYHCLKAGMPESQKAGSPESDALVLSLKLLFRLAFCYQRDDSRQVLLQDYRSQIRPVYFPRLGPASRTRLLIEELHLQTSRPMPRMPDLGAQSQQKIQAEIQSLDDLLEFLRTKGLELESVEGISGIDEWFYRWFAAAFIDNRFTKITPDSVILMHLVFTQFENVLAMLPPNWAQKMEQSKVEFIGNQFTDPKLGTSLVRVYSKSIGLYLQLLPFLMDFSLDKIFTDEAYQANRTEIVAMFCLLDNVKQQLWSLRQLEHWQLQRCGSPPGYPLIREVLQVHSMIQMRLPRKIWLCGPLMKTIDKGIEYTETLFNADLVYETATSIQISVQSILQATLKSFEATYDILMENQAGEQRDQAIIQYLFGDQRQLKPGFQQPVFAADCRTQINFLAVMKDSYAILLDNHYEKTEYQEAAKKFQQQIQDWDDQLQGSKFDFNAKFLTPLTTIHAMHHIWDRLGDVLEQSLADTQEEKELAQKIVELQRQVQQAKPDSQEQEEFKRDLAEEQSKLEIVRARQPLSGTALQQFQEFLQKLVFQTKDATKDVFAPKAREHYTHLFYEKAFPMPWQANPEAMKYIAIKRSQFQDIFSHADPFLGSTMRGLKPTLASLQKPELEKGISKEYRKSLKTAYADLVQTVFQGRGQGTYPAVSYPLTWAKDEALSPDHPGSKALVDWISALAQQYPNDAEIQELLIGEGGE